MTKVIKPNKQYVIGMNGALSNTSTDESKALKFNDEAAALAYIANNSLPKSYSKCIVEFGKNTGVSLSFGELTKSKIKQAIANGTIGHVDVTFKYSCYGKISANPNDSENSFLFKSNHHNAVFETVMYQNKIDMQNEIKEISHKQLITSS